MKKIRMKKFRISVISVLMITVLLLSACSTGNNTNGANKASDESDDRVLNISIPHDLTSVDPHGANTIHDYDVWTQIYEPLYSRNEVTGELVPRIAESYTISDDGTTYTFNIRKGVKFHNGNELKASDVVFSFERAMGLPIPSAYLTSVEEVTATDDYTVTFTLNKPDAAFIINQYLIFVVSQEEVEAQGDEFGTKVFLGGTGPYYLTLLKRDTEWTLEAFSDYYMGEPEIKKVRYVPITDVTAGQIALESGELDWYAIPVSSWDALSANPNFNSELVITTSTYFVGLNFRNGPLEDDNLRLAIAYAIDKEAINVAAVNGLGREADFLVPEQHTGAPTEGLTYNRDLEKAKEYLAKSDYPEGTNIGTISCASGSIAEKIAQVLQANLGEIGLTTDIKRLDATNMYANIRAQEYDIAVDQREIDGDFEGYRNVLYTKSEGSYRVKFKDSKFDWEKMDELWDAGIAVTDVDERTAIYTELNNMIMETVSILPVIQNVRPFVWTKDLTIPMNNPCYAQIYEWSWNDQ